MKSLLYSSVCITMHNMLCINLYKKILCPYHNHLKYSQSNIIIIYVILSIQNINRYNSSKLTEHFQPLCITQSRRRKSLQTTIPLNEPFTTAGQR